MPVLDSTEVTAAALKTALAEKDLLSDQKSGSDQFYVSDFSENFLRTTKLFYPEKVNLEQKNIW